MSIVPSAQSDLPIWSLEHLRIAIDAAGVGLWSWNVDDDRITMDERALALWGVAQDGPVTFEDLSAKIHPQDLDRVRAAFASTRGHLGAYEIDFRILFGDDVRWVSARGRGSHEGIVGRTMYGIFIDVSQRKQAEEANELLAGEMSHRVKNLLAVAGALATITSRSAKTTSEMTHDLTQRLAALGRAQDLVGIGARRTKEGALLGDLLTVLLAPYDDTEPLSKRVRVSTPKIYVGEATATTLALVLHELATNSLKFGALSVPAGILDVSCSGEGADVLITWAEHGGPSVVPSTDPTGFGGKMMAQSMSRHLGGSISFDWAEAGVIATLRVNKERLGK